MLIIFYFRKEAYFLFFSIRGRAAKKGVRKLKKKAQNTIFKIKKNKYVAEI